MMLQSIDEEEKVKVNNVYFEGRTGGNGTWFLTEDGLYEVLMQSRNTISILLHKFSIKKERTQDYYIPCSSCSFKNCSTSVIETLS